jgi:hypothetical protein
VTTHDFKDEAPTGSALTPYDRAHMALYLRLIDSWRDGADWREAVAFMRHTSHGRAGCPSTATAKSRERALPVSARDASGATPVASTWTSAQRNSR